MDINIQKTENISKIHTTFPSTWIENIEQEIKSKCMVFIIENIAGCLIKRFDGMNILFNLWTHESYRNKGYARSIVEYIGKENLPLPTFARYRNNEKNVEKLFYYISVCVKY